MTPDGYRRAKLLFFELCDLPLDVRRARLDGVGDADVRAEVESLLRLQDDDPLLRTGAGGEVFELAAGVPERIGPFRLIRRLGVGGMGVAYEAEQDFPRRRVAIKLLRAGSLVGDAERRFRREAEALARLQHPCVAQLYEAGAVDTGRGVERYIAMELVRGEPLDAYARRHALSIRRRLELFCQVCRGVEAAHAVGVVHRDLKPANILVGETGQPKIVDFGVAQFAESPDTMSRLTTPGQLVGTLAYMSPEQVRAEGAALDHRIDVYALGATLFELLTGRAPVDLAGLSLPEALRRLQNAEPSRLGTLESALRGDLETIAAKALESDVSRRYETVAALRADIERHLRHEPISARPASAAYRIRKFASRHRALVAAGVSIFAILSVALVVITLQWRRAERLRAEAVASERRARALVSFFADDLMGGLEAGRFGVDARLVDLLDDAAGRIEQRFAGDPAVAGMMHQQAASMYSMLGRNESQIRHAKRALPLLREAFGSSSRESILAEQALGEAYAEAQDVENYLRYVRPAASHAREAFGLADDLTLSTQVSLADALQMAGRYDEAEALLREAIEIYRRRATADNPAYYRALNVLGASLTARRHFADAEPIIAEELEGARRLRPAGHPQLVAALNNYARVLSSLGRAAEAEPVQREAIEQAAISSAPDHWRTAVLRQTLADILLRLDRPAAALHEGEQALQGLNKGFDKPTIFHLNALSRIVHAQVLLERWDDAVDSLKRLLDATVDMGADLTPAVNVLGSASEALLANDRGADLAALLRQARSHMRPSDSSYVRCCLLEARCLSALQRYDEARALLAGVDKPDDPELAERLASLRAEFEQPRRPGD
ncbi:MAG: serine/threonine protein kinase [Planctomycetota bacterium]|nr:MAG: serine/threonine protein kinase [Planctomycetota bacterium]